MIRAIMFIGALFVGTLNGACDEELFLQANKQYHAKQYEKALATYTTIKSKGCATWHNMGNCAFQLHKPLDALVCWRKAQRGADAREFDELQRNIEASYEILGKRPEGNNAGRFADNLLGRFSLLSLQLLFLFTWFLLFSVLWLTRRYKKGVLIMLIPLNLLLGTATFLKYRSHSRPPAIVVKESTTLFAGPDQHYQVMGTAHMADEFKVVARLGEWCMVRGYSLAGWALADTLEVI